MKLQMHLCVFLTLTVVAMVFGKSHFLAEKPPFIKTCRQMDPKFKSCFAQNFGVIFRQWKDGIPGLKSAGSLDPLYVKRIGISQENNNPLIQLSVNLQNVKIMGISETITQEINIDFDNAIITGKFRAPKLEIESDYTVNGRLLNLPLDGSGKAHLKIDDFNMDILMNIKLRDEFGQTFTDIDQLQLEISNIGGFHINLENLFNGNQVLEESTNLVINENWRDFYAVLGPAIKDTIQDIMYDRFKKVFGYVPATYFIEDISTAAEYYG